MQDLVLSLTTRQCLTGCGGNRVWLEQGMPGVLGGDVAFWIITLKVVQNFCTLILDKCH